MHNYYWYKMAAYEKIAKARSEAAHDRLVIAADKSRRENRDAARSPHVRVLQGLVSAFGHGRPVLGGTVAARQPR